MIKKIHHCIVIIFLLMSQHMFAQHLLSDSLLVHYTQQQMATIFGEFGAPGSATTGVYGYRLIYSTWNAQHTDTTIASGLVMFPDTVTCPLAVASYDHGTTLLRHDVPSFLNDEAIIAQVLAGEGYYTVAPDYLGMGVSPIFLHPYVHAASEAQATVDLIFAAKTFAAANNIPLSQQLFLTGYSQGGHACMAAHRLIQEQYAGQLTVTAAAPGSGPYNLSGIQSAGLASDSFYANPSYIPYLIFAYQSVYGNLYDSVQQFLRYPWDSILPPLYNEVYSTDTIDGIMPHYVDSFVVAEQLQEFLNDSANDPLRVDLRENDVYAWNPKAPILMTYCTADEQVFYQNTLFTYNYFINEGDTSAYDNDGGSLDHLDCLFPALRNMFSFFDKYRVSENNLVLTLSADSETAAGAHNASVMVSVAGSTGYSILWSTGSTDSVVTGLSNGIYTVTVTDPRGCAQVRSVSTRPGATGIVSPGLLSPQIQIFPNPTSDRLNIKVTGFIPRAITIYDVNGRKVRDDVYSPQLDLGNLPPGIYVAEISGNNLTTRTRFVKM